MMGRRVLEAMDIAHRRRHDRHQEQVGNSMVNVIEGYLVETGRRTLTPEMAETTFYNPELNNTWYVDHFKGKGTFHSPERRYRRIREVHNLPPEHENYITSDPEFGTVVVSTLTEVDERGRNLRVIIRTKFVRLLGHPSVPLVDTQQQHLMYSSLPFHVVHLQCDVVSVIPKADFSTNTFKKTSVRDIVRAASPGLADRLPKANYKLIKNPALHAELEDFETKQVPSSQLLRVCSLTRGGAGSGGPGAVVHIGVPDRSVVVVVAVVVALHWAKGGAHGSMVVRL